MNENQNGQKLNLVNPLNPNEIIKQEIIMPKNNVVETNEIETEVENNNKKPKKKMNLIIILVLVLIIVGLAMVYFVFLKDNKPKPPVNNNQTQEPSVPIALNNIVDIFNQNIINYSISPNTTVSAEEINNEIRVSVDMEESILNYSFTLNDRTMSITLSNQDDIGLQVTIYILSSIAQYHGVNFNDCAIYLNNNLDNLNEVNTLNVIDLETLIIISTNLDEIIEIK